MLERRAARAAEEAAEREAEAEEEAAEAVWALGLSALGFRAAAL